VSIRRRLEHLEVGAEKQATDWKIPPEVLVVTKMTERYRVRAEGRDPPPYTREEIEERRQQDLETVEGHGTEAHYRIASGWQSSESQALLDFWERDARRRVEKAKDLSPERWGEVWGLDDE
jgi:hypothetical protein